MPTDTPISLRDILKTKDLCQQSENTDTDNMQECPTTPLNDDISAMRTIVDTNDSHSDHSNQRSGEKSDDENLDDQSGFNAMDAEDVKSETEENGFRDTNSPSSTQGGSKEAKRARLDNIITSLPQYNDSDTGSSDMRQPTKKQHFVQQHEGTSRREYNNLEDELWQLRHQPHTVDNYFKQYDSNVSKPSQSGGYPGVSHIQRAYFANAATLRRPFEFHNGYAAVPRPRQNDTDKFNNTGPEENNGKNDRLGPAHFSEKESEWLFRRMSDPDNKELQQIIMCLQSNIEDIVTAVVDTKLSRLFQKRTLNRREESTTIKTTPSDQSSNTQDKKQTTTTDHSLSHIQHMPDRPSSNGFRRPGRQSYFELPKLGSPKMPRTLFQGFAPPLSYYPQSQIHTPLYSCAQPEQTEPLSLVVTTPKRKRTKVIDTRLSTRAVRAQLQDNTPSMFSNGDHCRPQVFSFEAMLAPGPPTSVAIPKPSLQHSDVLSFYKQHTLNGSPMKSERYTRSSTHSPSDAFVKSDYDENCHSFDSQAKPDPGSKAQAMDRYHTDTLTSLHLRKAKLMFFYVRYPSSVILREYFPDVKFNKNNYAQLVKWFSNFREFYYEQIDKYARKAIAEGFECADEIVVTFGSELFRVINFHYNRNNQIEVPEKFRLVVQETLREFFIALKANTNAEPSWKKCIYKVIIRMDDSLPEYFKSHDWMEKLSDV